MRFLRRSQMVTIINRLPVLFDAHDAEKRALRDFPLEFGAELRAHFWMYRDPVHQFSCNFGRELSRFSGQIVKTRKIVSDNLGGRSSRNQQWQRVVPTIR